MNTNSTPVDAAALLMRLMRIASALGAQRSTAFLTECRDALDNSDAAPADLLAPIVERWTREATS